MTRTEVAETTLGEVTCPSGVLVVLDGGYLGVWSGEASPATVDPADLGVADPELAEAIRSAVDYEIVGPDAEAAGRSFGRQAGVTLYDVPGTGVERFVAEFDAHCREHGFDARLRAFPEQVSHRERARRAVAYQGVDEFQFFGVPAVAIGGVAGRTLPVRGLRLTEGEFKDQWASLAVHVGEGPVRQSVQVAVVGVDWARLMVADVDALAHWQHDEPIDGLADVAFWGRDADAVAAEFDAPMLGTAGEEGVRGWAGLPVVDAVRKAIDLEAWQGADPERRFAIDFRPHSHHWQVMAGVRAAETESATISVGGAELLMAMTSWGDGVFPVFVDLGEDGEVVAVRVEFFSEEG